MFNIAKARLVNVALCFNERCFLILYYRRQITPYRGFHRQRSTIWKFRKRRLSGTVL